jgi:hypothetical protein
LVPIAAFITGALLTLLLPVALLISLTVWYWLYSAREPAADDPAPGSASRPVDPSLPPEPSQPAPEA